MKFFYVLLTLLVLSSFSCGTTNNTGNTGNTGVGNVMAGDIITILGTVRIFGNEPRTEVGIVDRTGITYFVSPRSAGNDLRLLQGRLIEFKAVLLDVPPVVGFNGGTVTPIEWNVLPLQ